MFKFCWNLDERVSELEKENVELRARIGATKHVPTNAPVAGKTLPDDVKPQVTDVVHTPGSDKKRRKWVKARKNTEPPT